MIMICISSITDDFLLFTQMDLDTFINYLSQKEGLLINIFVSHDKLYAEFAISLCTYYLNVAHPSWTTNNMKQPFKFSRLNSNVERSWGVQKTSLNPYHYSIVHTNFIISTSNQLIKLKKIIEDVYDRLPSKVDIYRYKNDYDLKIEYN